MKELKQTPKKKLILIDLSRKVTQQKVLQLH